MLSPSDLSDYLARIRYHGVVAPTRKTLAALQLAHLTAIPFETLDSVILRSPRLDLSSVIDKLVHSQRGGYCYEHNALFRAALENFGFRPVGLLARVLLGQREEAETPRSHMLLRVQAEGADFIVDVGFGGQVPTGPIRLTAGVVQQTPHEPYRLEEPDGIWGLRAMVGGEWRLLYRFTLEPAFDIDYVQANHYTSTHPDAFFTQALVAARILPNGRLTLLNHRLTEHRLGEPASSQLIADDAALRAVLAERFGIEVEDGHWDAAVRKIAAVRAA